MKQTAEEQIKELKQQLAMANEKIAQLTAIIKLQKNQIFGKKTEVMEPVVDGQQSLFSEQEMDQLQDPDISVTEVTEKKIKQVVRHRKAKQSGQRTTFLDGLPQIEEVIRDKKFGMESLSIPESVYPKKQDYELPKMIIHSPVVGIS